MRPNPSLDTDYATSLNSLRGKTLPRVAAMTLIFEFLTQKSNKKCTSLLLGLSLQNPTAATTFVMLIPSYTSLFQNKTTELSCTYPSYPRLNSSAVKYELYARRALVLNCLKVVTGQACFVQSCFTMDLLAYRQLSLYSHDQAA